MTDKEIINLLNSLIHSGDLKLKVSIKDDVYDSIATASLSYKGRKIANAKYNKSKSEAAYE